MIRDIIKGGSSNEAGLTGLAIIAVIVASIQLFVTTLIWWENCTRKGEFMNRCIEKWSRTDFALLTDSLDKFLSLVAASIELGLLLCAGLVRRANAFAAT